MKSNLETGYYFIEATTECQLDAFYFEDEGWTERHDGAFHFGGDVVDQLVSPNVHFSKLSCLVNDYLSYGSLIVISAELAGFLQGKIQAKFLPINGFYKGEACIKRQFYLVCLLEHIEPLDLNESIYTSFTNESTGKTFVTNLDKIVLAPERINNSVAFKMNPLGFYLFREDICRAILTTGFKGLRFIPVERYRQTKIEDLTRFSI